MKQTMSTFWVNSFCVCIYMNIKILTAHLSLSLLHCFSNILKWITAGVYVCLNSNLIHPHSTGNITLHFSSSCFSFLCSPQLLQTSTYSNKHDCGSHILDYESFQNLLWFVLTRLSFAMKLLLWWRFKLHNKEIVFSESLLLYSKKKAH